ncbi:acid-sensing ion channel 4-A isoform X2 [Bactrocera neohumeralis]|uniref:acid-sensing ion channel 4-A isoform X2 n=1 Tax=Bactrocera tryoni TaxID=59916 RepID=UPI001A96AEB5|nr:acid-sensing ion channel 4-A isoform X2 [Bactrocera tryoni]XP_050338894.1 acid-sensing ion channel 4-A isoform X2 [Bactrocera neohumeralis]
MGYWLELLDWILRDPGKLIRYLVLFVCSVIVIVQLSECFTKLNSPPISTHSYFSLNDTVEMPAVTICREPPYKEDVLNSMSGGICPHPKYITCWNNFPFNDLELDDFFMNSTFDLEETILGEQYGLDGLTKNLEIKTSLHFYMGRCYTLNPKIELKRTTRTSGYSLMLTHHIIPGSSMEMMLEKNPGWHVYIHDHRHEFTELNVKGAARSEYIFAEIDEEIEIKLQSQQFRNIESKETPCSATLSYSDMKCAELCVFDDLATKTNCTGPWMTGILQQPCDNSKSMRALIKDYGIYYESDDDIECDCKRPCNARIYSTFIQSRKQLNSGQQYTQVWIYYSTKLVSMVEERLSYDTTQFIADIGGSLGFLLGLSVLGLIGILEHLTLFFCGGLIKKQLKHEKQLQDDAERQSQKSDATDITGTTLDIATISREKKTYMDEETLA